MARSSETKKISRMTQAHLTNNGSTDPSHHINHTNSFSTSAHLPSVGPVVCTTRTRGGPPAPPPPVPWGATERSIWFSVSESLSINSGIVIIGCNTTDER